MLSVFATGRLVRDPQTGQGGSGTTYTRFTIASDRRFNKDGGKKLSDFVDCVCFGKTAEFVAAHFTKGKGITLTGEMQTEMKEKEGVKYQRVDVLVSTVEFAMGTGAPTAAAAAPTARAEEPVAVGAGAADPAADGDYDPWATMGG